MQNNKNNIITNVQNINKQGKEGKRERIVMSL